MKNNIFLSNMEKLKILNLISVLNNIDDESLECVMNKIDNVRLLNHIYQKKCKKCDKEYLAHHKCVKCKKYKCYMFTYESNYARTYKCLDCVGKLTIASIYRDTYSKYKWVIRVKDIKYNKIYIIYKNCKPNLNCGPVDKKTIELFL